MSLRIFSDPARTSVICIDSYDGRVPTGRLYNKQYGVSVEFKGTIELLKIIDNMLDEAKYPQSFSVTRSFAPSKAPEGKSSPDEAVADGKLATFALKVLFRQNASWQGSVTWVEGKTEETFRSVLELLWLMDSALG